jgi:addiction module HigA family antidote
MFEIVDYHQGLSMPFERRKNATWSIHPGEILKEEFLVPLEISGYRLAKALGVNARRISDILLRKSGISADMAIRLAAFFETSPEFWMNLQAAYELSTARKSLRKQIGKIKPHSGQVA